MNTDPLSFNLPDLIMRLMTWQWDLKSSYSDFPRLFQELSPEQLQVYLSGPTPVELPGCSLGSTARRTPMKALLWTTDFHFYARVRWLAETLDAAVARLSEQMPVYIQTYKPSTAVSLIERFSVSVQYMLHLLNELSEQQDTSDHYRKKLKKIRQELHLLLQEEIDQYS